MEIAFTADIEKIYRQIKINKENQEYYIMLQRFYDQEYKITTLTYGTESAPYLPAKTVQQLKKNEKELFPLASHVTMQNSYVDDLLLGADNQTDAMQLQ